MPYLVGVLAALCVTLLLVALYELIHTPARAVARELEEIRNVQPSPFGSVSRRRRQSRKERLRDVVQMLGDHVERGGLDVQGWAKRLVQAGFWNPEAPKIFFGTRVAATAGLMGLGFLVGVLFDARLLGTMFLALWLGGVGWLIPSWYVLRVRAVRRMQIQTSLADALDLLVACVEAGMGLNQAMVRVAEEIRNVSEPLSEELAMLNLEIRAGTPRPQAFRNLADRTGLEDMEALVSTLIQTERFGTSVGRALRIQSDTLRQTRRQRAEEAAAKTTIKLVFPLVLFVFPALFVVILGPAVIQVVRALMEMQ
ncbi:MAG TPA: type II secretion system F family protein [Longimicrobiales bacterium]|nr:type II secretion system F family protein [Longimicrobiales bacterium]